MKCSSIIESMEDRIDPDDECGQQGQHDAIIQVSAHYAFIFVMYDDLTFGENRDIAGGEPPEEYEAEGTVPYLSHVDCGNCGEEMIFTDDEDYLMRKNPEFYLPAKVDLAYAIKCAEELELENY